MLKQSLRRTKVFKIKQSFKILTLIVIGIWLLYQLRHSHDKKLYEESSAKVFENLKAGPKAKKLGRKAFQPWTNNKAFELMDDTEEIESERVKEQKEDKVEEEESEEVEDLIDEEDKEKEEQNLNEDEYGEDIGKQIEDMNLLEEQVRDEGENDSQGTSEEHDRETDALRAVMSVTKTLGSEFEFGGLRKVKEEEVESSKRAGKEKQKKKIMEPSNLSPKW